MNNFRSAALGSFLFAMVFFGLWVYCLWLILTPQTSVTYNGKPCAHPTKTEWVCP